MAGAVKNILTKNSIGRTEHLHWLGYSQKQKVWPDHYLWSIDSKTSFLPSSGLLVRKWRVKLDGLVVLMQVPKRSLFVGFYKHGDLLQRVSSATELSPVDSILVAAAVMTTTVPNPVQVGMGAHIIPPTTFLKMGTVTFKEISKSSSYKLPNYSLAKILCMEFGFSIWLANKSDLIITPFIYGWVHSHICHPLSSSQGAVNLKSPRQPPWTISFWVKPNFCHVSHLSMNPDLCPRY